MKIGVPAYFYPQYPDPKWGSMQTATPTCRFAVANVNSGPGSSPDENYKKQITAARSAGLQVFGYVHTSYGRRSLSDVQSEVDKWFSYYAPLDGIFYDETSQSCSDFAYYTTVYQYAKKNNPAGIVVVNPGTVVPACLNSTGDIIVNFEDTEGTYNNWKAAGWEDKFPPEKFWHIVHTASSSSLPQLLSLAKSRNSGNIYITDKTLPNPYDGLPSYWTTEVTLVAKEL